VESFADDGSETVDQPTTSTTINGLEEFAIYDITVQVVYRGRSGFLSNTVTVITFSDGK